MRVADAGLLVLTAVGGCSPPAVSMHDAGVDLAQQCIPNQRCSGGVCLAGQCVPSSGPCGTDPDCSSDSFCFCTGVETGQPPCSDGACLPWDQDPLGPYNDACAGAPSAGRFDVAQLAPEEVCHFRGIGSYFTGTPAVGDLDGDGRTEVVVAYAVGSFGNLSARLAAFHSDDCSTLWDVDLPGFGFDLTAPTLADLDGDGRVEVLVVAGDPDRLVQVFDAAGAVVSQSSESFGTFKLDVAVGNADGSGTAELAAESVVMQYPSWVSNTPDIPSQFPSYWAGASASTFADLDGDGHLELIANFRFLDAATGADKTPMTVTTRIAEGGGAGFPAVADFDGDGSPDVVFLRTGPQSDHLTVYSPARDQILFGRYAHSDSGQYPSGYGGPPLVDDFDGDGVPDIGVAGSESYCVYSLRCAASPLPSSCKEPGILWCAKTQDYSSGITGATSLDLNGDGIAEIVYRDECWLRIFDGATGGVRFAESFTSGTFFEMPVLADVDGDGSAELIVTGDYSGSTAQGATAYCNNGAPDPLSGTPWAGPKLGVYVLKDKTNRWARTRRIWPSQTYHITEVNDDLTVPLHEMPSWLDSNSFRRNADPERPPSSRQPDFTARPGSPLESGGSCGDKTLLSANLCNRGAHAAKPGVAGSFYASDPGAGAAPPLCTAMTATQLGPGQCELVSCTVPTQGAARTIWFRADDTGAAFPAIPECLTQNDATSFSVDACAPVN